jgi:hypothetical protein
MPCWPVAWARLTVLCVRACHRVLETTVRSFNNLIEKLHHSVTIYILIDNNIFAGLGKFTPVFVVALLPLGLHALFLFFSHVTFTSATAPLPSPSAAPVMVTVAAIADPASNAIAASAFWARVVGTCVLLVVNWLICIAALLLPAVILLLTHAVSVSVRHGFSVDSRCVVSCIYVCQSCCACMNNIKLSAFTIRIRPFVVDGFCFVCLFVCFTFIKSHLFLDGVGCRYGWVSSLASL